MLSYFAKGSKNTQINEVCPSCDQKSANYFNHWQGKILKCQTCKILFAEDRRGELSPNLPKWVKDQIKSEYEILIKESKASSTAIAKGIAQNILSLRPNSKRLLEVGCGGAELGSVWNELVTDASYTGIESSAHFYETISDKLKSSVIFDEDWALALSRVPDASQEVIVLNHVLEHLPLPKTCLNELKTKLAPGGIFYLEVPNEQWKLGQTLVRNLITSDGLLWFPGHINFFTKKSLSSLLRACNLKTIRFDKGRIADNLPTFSRMTGGDFKYKKSVKHKIFFNILKYTRVEQLMGYGIVLRFICEADDSAKLKTE